ncbi:MAG: hypothetical protein NZ901_10335 [Geminocystis sp.]|nr:hypothetical protein [Geminocystis sp.]MCS7148573.1 hypothetical protein [Geminocystis sp.]MDW8115035.1 hypothetical protein [Geminocystis sp.]MDW8464303.1 hypothetical protein [Geminocystis sp.]
MGTVALRGLCKIREGAGDKVEKRRDKENGSLPWVYGPESWGAGVGGTKWAACKGGVRDRDSHKLYKKQKEKGRGDKTLPLLG